VQTTDATPATDEQSEEERGLAVPSLNGVADLGVIEGEVREVDLAISDVAPTLPDRQRMVEVDVVNGPAHVGDPVIVRGQRGVIVDFLWKAPTVKRAGRWQVLVRFDAVGDAQAYERAVNANDVAILLDEVGRPPRPMPAAEAAEPTTPGPEPQTKAKAYPVPVTGFRAGYQESMGLERIAERLYGKHVQLGPVSRKSVQFFWWEKIGKKSCEGSFGQVKKITGMLSYSMEGDVYVAVSAFAARAGNWTEEDVELALFHLLLHVVVDEKGNVVIGDHDFDGFTDELVEYGPKTSRLKIGRNAYRRAEQLGLVESGDSDEDDE
jgi:hypothetical protein